MSMSADLLERFWGFATLAGRGVGCAMAAGRCGAAGRGSAAWFISGGRMDWLKADKAFWASWLDGLRAKTF